MVDDAFDLAAVHAEVAGYPTLAAAVVVATLVVTTWLLAIASSAKSGTDLANARLDAVRTGLAAGAGVGAAVTDLDATERRITELYTMAVEQLGNDKAPVRLGGLYALERLAQDTQHTARPSADGELTRRTP